MFWSIIQLTLILCLYLKITLFVYLFYHLMTSASEAVKVELEKDESKTYQ